MKIIKGQRFALSDNLKYSDFSILSYFWTKFGDFKPKSNWKTPLLIGVFFLFLPANVFGEVRTSENYRIFADTLSSGGEYSTSSNFRLWDTIGEAASEQASTSTNFQSQIGFQGIVPDNSLSATLNRTSINLGDISSNGVTNENLTITYSTNANGFTSTISEDGNLRTSGGGDVDDVADGSVTAGNEEYGIRTAGSIGQQNSADTSITGTAKTIASRSDPTPSSEITLTFKVSVSSNTPTGDYSHAVTISTSGNF